MQLRQAHAPARQISAGEAAALVRSGMWLDYGMSLCQPDVFDAALGARIHELHDVKVRSCLTLKPRAVLEADPKGDHVHWISWHFSGYDRRKHDAGRAHYAPLNLGEVPDYYRRFVQPVDIVILKVCPMDEHGWFNFSGSNMWHRAIIERAHVVIVEVTRGLPWVHGEANGVHVSEVDFVLEGDHAPATEFPNPAPNDIDRAVARFVTNQAEDGACVQVGIGAMPNAVCGLLAQSGIRDLGVHTEMMTDGIVDLYLAGLVTGARKNLNPGKLVYTFALGSRRMYDTMVENADMLACAVDYTNAPNIIMQNERVFSINSTTQVDLQGQANSESDGNRHLTGTGGQLQFVRGAYASKGGKSFICLSSAYERNGERKSRIVFNLPQGSIVTTPRSDVMYVVTEYGIVNLKGKSVPERARALISIAHPDFREDLERKAHAQGLLPKGLSF